MQPTEAPRFYLVSMPTGIVRRNHQHLTTIPESNLNSDTRRTDTNVMVQPPSTTVQTTRSGHVSVPPKYLIADPQ